MQLVRVVHLYFWLCNVHHRLGTLRPMRAREDVGDERRATPCRAPGREPVAMAIDPPTAGTIDAENHRDAFVPGPTEQSELEMLREFESEVREAHREDDELDESVSIGIALRDLDRKRGR